MKIRAVNLVGCIIILYMILTLIMINFAISSILPTDLSFHKLFKGSKYLYFIFGYKTMQMTMCAIHYYIMFIIHHIIYHMAHRLNRSITHNSKVMEASNQNKLM